MFLSDIPLTQSLRINTKCTKPYLGAREERSKDAYQTKVHFYLEAVANFFHGNATVEDHETTNSIYDLFRQYCESMESGDPTLEIDSTYLFDTLSYDVFVNIHPTKTGTFKVKYLSRGAFRALLLDYTSWFPSLKPEIQEKLLNLREKFQKKQRGTSKPNQEFGCSKLRRVLEATDLIVVGFFLGGENNRSISRIQNAVLSNLVSDGEEGYWSFVKLWKTFIKKVRKHLFSRGDFTDFFKDDKNLPRRLSWVKSTEFYHRLIKVGKSPDYPYNWETLEPLCIVLQTRSIGLANGIAEQESIEKFIHIVTDDDDNYDYKWIWKGSKYLNCKVHDSGILNLTSAACVEASRKEGGKFSMIKKIIKEIYDQGGEYLIDFSTGKASDKKTLPPKPTCDGWDNWPEYLNEELGHYLFSWAVNQFRKGNNSWSTLHISTVIEQGKARVVTPGSILTFLLLMPLSHSTLRMIESIPEIKVGVSDTDDGWQFWKRMGPSDKSSDYLETNKQFNDCFFCADLETATDYAPWGLVENTLDLLEDKGVPSWYINIAKIILTSPRKIFFEDENVIKTSRGAMMADPVTKTVLTVSHFCLIKAVLNHLGCGGSAFAIKGDDVIVKLPVSKSNDFEMVYREAMTRVGFKLSEDDTFISRTYGFYCESIFRMYSETRESPTSFHTLVDKRDPSYCDVPTVKLAFPTWKDNRRIGDVPEGKISLLSRRMGWMDPRSIQYFQYEILNIIQWLYFRMEDRNPIFLYGPNWRGGLNKRPPFGKFKYLLLTDQERKRLVLDYRYIISRAIEQPSKYHLDNKDLDTIEESTKSFILRNSNDEFSDLVMMDYNLPSEPIWTSKDERYWNIGLGERLKKISGITTDRSIKSRVATVCNLSGISIPTKVVEPEDQDKYQDLLHQMDPNDLQDVYDIYVRRVANRDYGYVNWSLYLEDQFPLYNAMKVNPSDRSYNTIRQVVSTIQQSITTRKDWGETKDLIVKDYDISIGDLESLHEAIILHNNTKRLTYQVTEQQYKLLEFKEIDYDSRAHLELRYMYTQVCEWFHKTNVLHQESPEELHKILLGQSGPKRVLIWASRDKSRLTSLRKESYEIWNSLNIPPSMYKYTFVNVLHYLPVGEQTDFGFMLYSLEYKSGFNKYINPGTEIDPYDPGDSYITVLDIDSTESTAQELLSRGLVDSREVGYANRTIPMGYSVTNIVGVLTS